MLLNMCKNALIRGLLIALKHSGVVSDQHLGTVTGKYINGHTLKSMKMIDKVDKLDSDLKESMIVSDLMVDIPPISKEDNPVLLVEFVTRHFKETGEIINLNSIPDTIAAAPLRIAMKIKSKKATSEVVDDVEPKAKKPKKEMTAPQLNMVESALSSIQEEVVDLEHVKVLNKMTRGGTTVGSSKAAFSQPKQKD
jgi:hypothetical protein